MLNLLNTVVYTLQLTCIRNGLFPIFLISARFRSCCCTNVASNVTSMNRVKILQEQQYNTLHKSLIVKRFKSYDVITIIGDRSIIQVCSEGNLPVIPVLVQTPEANTEDLEDKEWSCGSLLEQILEHRGFHVKTAGETN